MNKKTILFCRGYEPERIYFYSKVIKKLQENYEVICVSTSIQELKLFQKYGINSKLVELNSKTEKLTEEEVFKIGYFQKVFEKKNFRKINEKKMNEIILKLYHFYEKLDEVYSFEKIILWSGIGSIVDSTLNYYIKKKNKIAYYLEDGYFRPYSLTCDKKGINYYNSVPRNIEFYNNYILSNISKQNVENTEKIKIYKTNKFYKLYDYIFKTNIEYCYIDFLSLVTSNLKRKKILKKRESLRLKSLEEEYIFIPFQLEVDTQFILFSPIINSMKHLVEETQKAIIMYNEKNNKNLKLVFKIHPKDDTLNISEIKKVINNKISYFLTEGNTEELIRNSKMVITINSTVGIEALNMQKKVLTLGKAFYNIDKIVKNCTNLENLPDDIYETLKNDYNSQNISKFLSYLKNDYFLNVNWRKINDFEIQTFIKKIEEPYYEEELYFK